MNLNSDFLRWTVVIYVFVYRNRMFGFGSSFLWLVSHCGIMVMYIVKLIQKGICHQALNDLVVPNLALPQRWQICMIGTVRIFSLGLTGQYESDAMHSAIHWRAHFTLVAVAFQIESREVCGSYLWNYFLMIYI